MSSDVVMSKCIICSLRFKVPSEFQTHRLQQKHLAHVFERIFNVFCKYLHLNRVLAKGGGNRYEWDFEEETLPFCAECKQTVAKLVLLHDQIESIQGKISKIVADISATIMESQSSSGNQSNSNSSSNSSQDEDIHQDINKENKCVKDNEYNFRKVTRLRKAVRRFLNPAVVLNDISSVGSPSSSEAPSTLVDYDDNDMDSVLPNNINSNANPQNKKTLASKPPPTITTTDVVLIRSQSPSSSSTATTTTTTTTPLSSNLNLKNCDSGSKNVVLSSASLSANNKKNNTLISATTSAIVQPLNNKVATATTTITTTMSNVEAVDKNNKASVNAKIREKVVEGRAALSSEQVSDAGEDSGNQRSQEATKDVLSAPITSTPSPSSSLLNKNNNILNQPASTKHVILKETTKSKLTLDPVVTEDKTPRDDVVAPISKKGKSAEESVRQQDDSLIISEKVNNSIPPPISHTDTTTTTTTNTSTLRPTVAVNIGACSSKPDLIDLDSPQNTNDDEGQVQGESNDKNMEIDKVTVEEEKEKEKDKISQEEKVPDNKGASGGKRKRVFHRKTWPIEKLDGGKYQCVTCNAVENSREDMFSHIDDFHPGSKKLQYKCPTCDREFVAFRSFLYHQQTVHYNSETGMSMPKILACGPGRFVCEKQWCFVETEAEKFQCQKCGFVAENERPGEMASIIKHIMKHKGVSETGVLTCQFCEQKFKRKQALRMHVWVNHQYKLDMEEGESVSPSPSSSSCSSSAPSTPSTSYVPSSPQIQNAQPVTPAPLTEAQKPSSVVIPSPIPNANISHANTNTAVSVTPTTPASTLPKRQAVRIAERKSSSTVTLQPSGYESSLATQKSGSPPSLSSSSPSDTRGNVKVVGQGRFLYMDRLLFELLPNGGGYHCLTCNLVKKGLQINMLSHLKSHMASSQSRACTLLGKRGNNGKSGDTLPTKMKRVAVLSSSKQIGKKRTEN